MDGSGAARTPSEISGLANNAKTLLWFVHSRIIYHGILLIFGVTERFLKTHLTWNQKLPKVTASTTTRSTTRRSGDQMGDQITPGDQIDDQIPTATKMWKLGRPSGRLEQSGRPSGHQMKLASVRIYLRGPWYLPKRRNSNQIWSPRSDLVAHQVTGASGRRSGRGRCIQL